MRDYVAKPQNLYLELMICWVLDHIWEGFDSRNPILMSELSENDDFKANRRSEVGVYEGLCRKT